MKEKELHLNNWIVRIIGIAAVLILLLCVMIGAQSEKRKKDLLYGEATEAAKENIAVELKEYFGQYLTNQKGELKELTNTVEAMQDTGAMSIELTGEQQDLLIAGVLDNLTPEKIMELADVNREASANAITGMEKNIYDRLVEKFSDYYDDARLTDSQREAVADAVTVIVEKNIYDELEKRFESQEKYLTEIEKSISEKLDKVTNTVNNYRETVKELETKLKVVEKDSTNLEEVEKLREELSELSKSYQSFVSTAQPAINIVTNLSVAPTGDNDVLSAQAGYTLNQKISNLNVTLTNAYDEFATEITQKVNDNDKKQSRKLADAKANLESQIADNTEKMKLLDEARQAAEKALQTKSEEDVNALKNAMNKLGGDMSDDLQAAYDSLMAADTSNMEETGRIIEALEGSLNKDIAAANNNITSLRSDLKDAENALKQELAATQTNLEGQIQANDQKQDRNLANAQSTLQGQMDANDEKQSQNLADAKNNLQQQIRQMGDDVNNNIVAKLPTYTWSEDGNHLSISIPQQ